MTVKEWKEKRKQFTKDDTPFYTPNMECETCIDFKLHTEEQRAKYHPYMGHDVDNRNKKK